MNLDKKLKKYASHIDNPKYYQKVNDILLEAFEKDYQFESFSYDDLAYIHNEIDSFFDTLQTEEERDRMIKFCNSYWVVVSDKNYVLGYTPNLLTAIYFIIKSYFIIFFSKIRQSLDPTIMIDFEHINKDMYLCHGALKAAKLMGCDFLDLSERMVELN